MRKLLLATRNRGKVREIKGLLDGLPVEVLSLEDYPEIPPVEEDLPTFAGNALKKAETAARASGEIALADDSGLEVEALNGQPGVYSARFAGPGADDEANNRLLLEKLNAVPPERRGAVFRCAIALVLPGGETHLVEDSCPGRIAPSPRGSGGFGYDPLFIYEPAGLTYAEMDQEAKSKISHRGKALRRARMLLEDLLSKSGG